MPREYKSGKIREVERIPLVAYAIIDVPKEVFGRKPLKWVDNAKTHEQKKETVVE